MFGDNLDADFRYQLILIFARFSAAGLGVGLYVGRLICEYIESKHITSNVSAESQSSFCWLLKTFQFQQSFLTSGSKYFMLWYSSGTGDSIVTHGPYLNALEIKGL